MPPDRFRFFGHHHHALVGHPRLRCAHLSNLVRFPPILFAPLLFWLNPAEPWVVPNAFARVSLSGTPSDTTRARPQSAWRVDGAWPPRRAAVPHAPFPVPAPNRARSDACNKKPTASARKARRAGDASEPPKARSRDQTLSSLHEATLSGSDALSPRTRLGMARMRQLHKNRTRCSGLTGRSCSPPDEIAFAVCEFDRLGRSTYGLSFRGRASRRSFVLTVLVYSTTTTSLTQVCLLQHALELLQVNVPVAVGVVLLEHLLDFVVVVPRICERLKELFLVQ